jgi:hypothetical protein
MAEREETGASEAQREAWQLRQTGLSWGQVGAQLGISAQCARLRGLRAEALGA